MAMRRIGGVALALLIGLALAPAGALAAGWSLTQAPAPEGPNEAALAGVSCWSAGACIAVGSDSYFDGNITSAGLFAEQWDGISWTLQSIPDPTGVVPTLSAVSCVSASWCMTVGYTTALADELHHRPLAEMWNGAAWSVVPTPTPSSLADLSAVSCVSVNFCVAVGTAYNSSSTRWYGLVESWDGTTWTIQPTPALPVNHNGSLAAVSCVSVGSCMATGGIQLGHASDNSRPLAERWNGHRWGLERVSHPSAGRLEGVSCISSSCLAVGGGGSEQPVQLPAIGEAWNGSRWRSTPLPTVPKHVAFFSAVSCLSASDCVAVGVLGAGLVYRVKPALLIERWNGHAWTTEHPSGTSGTNPQLRGVACPSSLECVAVGQRTSGESTLPLAALLGSTGQGTPLA